MNPVEDGRLLSTIGIIGVVDVQYHPDDVEFNKRAEMDIRSVLDQYKIEYCAISMFDGENANLEDIFEQASDIINSWIAKYPRGRILIKCGAGVSRSVSVLIYHMCTVEKITYEAAYDRIYDASPTLYIDSNLKDWLKARFSVYRLDEHLSAIQEN